MTQDLGYFSPELAAVIGLEEAVIFNKLQWCVENPQMGGTIGCGGKLQIIFRLQSTDEYEAFALKIQPTVLTMTLSVASALRVSKFCATF